MNAKPPIPYSADIRPQDTVAAQQSIVPTLYPNEQSPWAVDFSGTCPRCQDPIEVRKWLLTFVGALRATDKQMKALAAELDRQGIDRSHGDETFDLVCNCSIAHPKQPQGTSGCGATFRLRVTWP